MRVTYIQHSGFAVEYKDFVFLFDYYKGELPEFKPDKKVYVFASHAHPDHFTKKLFSWISKYPNITYILSDDIKDQGPEGHVVSIGADRERDLGGFSIRTFCSTDEGVAFLLTVGDKKIYHAGDLNWWHWEGEEPSYNQSMKERYQREIEKMKGERIDVAFVPVDPRLEAAYYWGLDYFMKQTETLWVFPMHMFGSYELCDRLTALPETANYRDRIVKITGEQQVFEV